MAGSFLKFFSVALAALASRLVPLFDGAMEKANGNVSFPAKSTGPTRAPLAIVYDNFAFHDEVASPPIACSNQCSAF